MRGFAQAIVPVLVAYAVAEEAVETQQARASGSGPDLTGFLAGGTGAVNEREPKRIEGSDQERLAGPCLHLPAPSDFDCHLCGGAQRWLFIVGTPEGGAREVLHMLGRVSPFIHIAGENGGIVSYLRMMRDGISNAQHQPDVPLNSWQHSDPAKSRRILCSMQKFVQDNLLGDYPAATKILGFEEVRHSVDDLDMFLHIWPCAQFIVATRANLTAQEESEKELPDGHTTTSGSLSSMDLRSQSKQLRLWASSHQSQTSHLSLEQLSVEKLNEILSWLGVSGCSFAAGTQLDQPEMTGTCSIAS
mmetsp:Transcript_23979/g.55353  ORF Transcript_23979/g.55353 Transcript_23979/m.55353 type:complete len:303 (-) Transcript_23979:77-985(-)